jgi:hypothetical protein
MKAFVRPRNKMSNRELIMLGVIAFLATMLAVVSMAVLILRSTGLKLKTENSQLSGKVSTLQGDLQDIGERLSGLSTVKSADPTEPAPVLSRIGLTATPGDTQLTVDTPEGWELVTENRLKSGGSTVTAQSEDIDLLTIDNYKVARVVEPIQLKDGKTAFVVFIKVSSDNKGYLSLSFCNPETGAACSYRGIDGKYVFVLAHAIQEGDQFARDMDFNSAEGIKLLTDFKVMMKSLDIS